MYPLLKLIVLCRGQKYIGGLDLQSLLDKYDLIVGGTTRADLLEMRERELQTTAKGGKVFTSRSFKEKISFALVAFEIMVNFVCVALESTTIYV